MRLLYRTSDGSKTDYTFSIEREADGSYVSYLVASPCACVVGGHAQLGLRERAGRLLVLSQVAAHSADEAKLAAALWADGMQSYLRTGSFPVREAIIAMHPENPVYGRPRDRPQSQSADDGPLGAWVDEQHLVEALSKEIFGQQENLEILARRVAQHSARRAPQRPMTMLAVGPTGVGKTQTAKALAKALEGDTPSRQTAYGFLRIDMNEYVEAHRVSQLLGAPQGYVGYGDGAQLVDALAASPRTLVLFDEVEKAHPKVLHALMNAMDAGRLSTSTKTAKGRDLDLRQAIFFFTSNAEAKTILDELRRCGATQPERVNEICRRRLQHAGVAPEFLGRIGTFLVFRPLSVTTRAGLLCRTIERVAEEYGLRIASVAPSVVQHVLARAPSGDFGARPDEYLVDDVLGPSFARVARQHPMDSIAILGPPFQCVLNPKYDSVVSR